jgi:hypothetical protein
MHYLRKPVQNQNLAEKYGLACSRFLITSGRATSFFGATRSSSQILRTKTLLP